MFLAGGFSRLGTDTGNKQFGNAAVGMVYLFTAVFGATWLTVPWLYPGNLHPDHSTTEVWEYSGESAVGILLRLVSYDCISAVGILLRLVSYDCMREMESVIGHKSEQNPYGTLPRILPNFCPSLYCI